MKNSIMKTLEELKTSNAQFSIGQALSDGWALVSRHLGYYILGGIVAVIISAAVSIIPFVGDLVGNIILSPCLMAGAIFVTWNISKGRGWLDFGDMFKGFNYLQPLAISTLIQMAASLILVVLVLFNFLPEITDIFKEIQDTDIFTRQRKMEEMIPALFTGKFIVSCLILMVAMLFITVLWAFKNHFIVIYKLQAWPAMEMSRRIARHNFLNLLGFFIIIGLIIIISALPCGIGLLFSLPLMIGATYSAFAQITGCDQPDEINEQMFDFMGDEKKQEQQ